MKDGFLQEQPNGQTIGLQRYQQGSRKVAHPLGSLRPHSAKEPLRASTNEHLLYARITVHILFGLS